MKSIEILISPTGQTAIQTKGFSGYACQDASRFLEHALGQRQNEQLTAEFYQSQTHEHHQQQETGE